MGMFSATCVEMLVMFPRYVCENAGNGSLLHVWKCWHLFPISCVEMQVIMLYYMCRNAVFWFPTTCVKMLGLVPSDMCKNDDGSLLPVVLIMVPYCKIEM
jgi:hypothetical protein